MRRNAADKVIEAYENYDLYFDKNSLLRVSPEGMITTQNTPIAYFAELEDRDGVYQDFLVITAQNFRSQSNWKKLKKQLADSANRHGYPVVFVKEIDIFYGEIENNAGNDWNQIISKEETFKKMIEIARYSQDKDIKTACCAFNENDELIAYTYNQEIAGGFVHAEQILLQYIDALQLGTVNTWLTLLEPCEHCLNSMVEAGAETIWFGHLHKDKWNTQSYIDLTNSIFARAITSYRGRPIVYRKYCSKAIEAFYKPKEEQ